MEETCGNLIQRANWVLTWEHGRQLASIKYSNTTWTHEHNADGLRTYRSNGTTTYTYVYNGSTLSQMTVNGSTLYFVNDTVTYNGTTYYYVKNLQGDIVAILDSTGTAVVEYTYNAWGVLLSTTGSMASTLGLHNPLRYRGYVYDNETALYYLQSRYYDPDVGRFINADDSDYLGLEGDLLSFNLFVYCGNNPVMGYDVGGCFDIWRTLKAIGKEFTKAAVVVTTSALAATIIIGAFSGTIASGGAGAVAIPAAMTMAASIAQAGAVVATVGVSVSVVGSAGENISYSKRTANSNSDIDRKFNVTKQKSKVFNKFNRVKGKSYRTSGNGKHKKYYDWDYTHNDIEVYDSTGKHLGSMNPTTGEMYKGAVKGRRLW